MASTVSSTSRTQVLSAYKNLLKTQKVTFKGDWTTLNAARQKTWTEFDAKRNETDPAKIAESLELAKQVASLLKHNLAQAQRIEGSEGVFALKLSEDHELGDNETLRQASKIRQHKNRKAAAAAGGATHSGCGSTQCCSH